MGRGTANVVARSTDDDRFETVAEGTKDRFGAESLERPALARTPQGRDGRWHLWAPVHPSTCRSTRTG